MLIITKDNTEKLRARIEDPQEIDNCKDEIKKMVEIKSALLWKADNACVCVGWQLQAHISWEIQTLESVLEALQDDDVNGAITLLDEYILRME